MIVDYLNYKEKIYQGITEKKIHKIIVHNRTSQVLHPPPKQLLGELFINIYFLTLNFCMPLMWIMKKCAL